MPMRVIPVPVFKDNYAYLLVDTATREAAAVDPAEPDKVLRAAQEHGVKLTTLLTTHHHADHAGGNEGVIAAVPGIRVVGSDPRIPGVATPLAHGDTVRVGGLVVKALLTPCHTTGSVSYFVEADAEAAGATDRAVFTGDTLFVAGCGRFFEGTAEQMYKSLIQTLAPLPHDTKVFCGHEYTAPNLAFAAMVEPDNQRIAAKAAWAATVGCTVPSTIGEELETNPFMRVDRPELQRRFGVADPIALMAELRELKNSGKPFTVAL
nr:hypothetical protein HK105_002265 [Polyrhizophydium stewartii]